MSERPTSSEPLRMAWTPGRPVDLRATLGPLHRGDVHLRLDHREAWWATRTPYGTGTISLRVTSTGVDAAAWGDGARWLIERVPALLGADDDWSQLDLSAYPGLAEVARNHPGLRLAATGRVLESLVPAIIEQRVTGMESRRSWRALVARFGAPAPGPDPTLRVPPDPQVLLDIPTWDWHRLGVEQARQRPVRAAATVAERVEQSTASDVLTRLQLLPGVGPWTAAETAQRAFGHPDAVSVGDDHLHDLVVYALTGRPRGSDEQMLELLEPWAGQRHRIVRLIELSGVRKPRFGPRYSPLDTRAM